MARKILLADDSVTAQNMGRKILADAGYDVVTVNNGSAALKRIAELKPDLIVLDVYMPGYSGLEVCQRLKDAGDTAHIPVLLTVGKLEPFKADEARRVRADSHIVKPFEASELLAAIARLEDRLAPHHSDGGRFAGAVVSKPAESFTETDTSWKSRLSFSKKKKPEKEEQEPPAEEVSSSSIFRDFRKSKAKPGASAGLTAASTAPAAIKEAEVIPEIPRDITPEELDALSAFALKLNGQTAEPEVAVAAPVTNVAAAELTATESKQAEVTAATTTAVAPVTEEKAVEATPEAAAFALEGKGEVEIPVQFVEPAVVDAASPAVAETQHSAQFEGNEQSRSEGPAEVQSEFKTEAQVFEPPTFESPMTAAVNAASFTEEAAPVDRDDEPGFASATVASIEVEPLQAGMVSAEVAALAESAEPASPVAQVVGEVAGEETQAETQPDDQVVASAAEAEPGETYAPVEAATSVVAETATDAASTDEVQAEDQSQSNSQSEESKPEKSEPYSAALREAEEAAPTDDELVEALRLLTPSTGYADFSSNLSESPVAAAGRLLAEEAMRNASGGPRWIAEPVMLSQEEASISLEAEMMLTLAATPAAASTEGIHSEDVTGVSAIAAAVETRLTEAGLSAGSLSAGLMDLSEIGSRHDSAPAEASATFADAISMSAGVFSENKSAENNQDSTSDLGSLESMAKKSKKSDGLHTQPDLQAGHGIEEPTKTMAAAASADNSASRPTPDASTIASIVDSVMADLRPRIVEEIARKLAGK